MGIISVSAPITKRSKMRMAHIQPLSRIACTLNIRPSRQIHTLSEVHLRSTPPTQFNPTLAMIKMFLAEVLFCTKNNLTDETSVFNFIDQSIEHLETNTDKANNFHLIFLIQYTRFLGFYPNISNFSEETVFDLQAGQFTKNYQASKQYLNLEKSITFAHLLRATFNTMHLFELTRQQRAEVLSHIIEYYAHHVPDFQTPKSLEVLQSF